MYNNNIENKAAECTTSARQLIDGAGMTEKEVLEMIAGKFYDNLNVESKDLISKYEFIRYVSKLLNPDRAHVKIADPNLEPWLEREWKKSTKIHWSAYRSYLIADGKSFAITPIDIDTYNILDYCHNPNIEGKWDRRGLVYGHVQSGKTANFIGLINKAFDIGYKLVIVFTGLTEDLRSQTQVRVNYGVIGRDGNGVGKYMNNGTGIKSMTNDGDLSSAYLDTITGLFNPNDKNILVVKKNKAVLESLIQLISYKSKYQNNGDYKLTGVPALIIDDEADNASIQSLSKKEMDIILAGEELSKRLDDENENDLTKDEQKQLQDFKESNIKTINKYLRVLLSLLGQKTFIGYTATPYSILAQQYESSGKEVFIKKLSNTFRIDKDSDLFPEHFIFPLKPSPKYMGITKMFGAENIQGQIVKQELPIHDIIGDKELNNNYPIGRKEEYVFLEIPHKLKEAINYFITAVYVRYHRKQFQHNTMLIHTSYLIKKIDYLACKVDDYLDFLRVEIMNNDNLINACIKNLEIMKSNAGNELLLKYFDEKESSYTFPNEIDKDELLDILENNLSVVSYHSSEDHSLNHRNHKLYYPDLSNPKNNKKYKNYIVVGGNRVSRGFTLEGLITTYFARKTTNQDTLYQMGRWFGYRIKYEDLIRLYMPKSRKKWFRSISNLEYQLRSDLKQRNSQQSDDYSYTPASWGIKMSVSKSFDSLNKELGLCSKSKLRRTQLKMMSISRTTLLVNIISKAPEIHRANIKIIQSFLESIWEKRGNKSCLYLDEHNINFTDIDHAKIIDLINDFTFEDSISKEFDLLIEFIKRYEERTDEKGLKLLKSFSVVLKQIKSGESVFNIQGREIHSIQRKLSNVSGMPNYKVSSLLDGDKDDTFDIITDTNKDEYKKAQKLKAKLRRKYRDESKVPLMIIILISGRKSVPNSELSPLAKEIIPVLYFFLPSVGEKRLVITKK